jgi:hypothetical protein
MSRKIQRDITAQRGDCSGRALFKAPYWAGSSASALTDPLRTEQMNGTSPLPKDRKSVV